MELIYLWVEDYKNIHKQGFNFSPRFDCSFDGENLTIDDNPDYIENFFGDNINITAIVGKNGSGKSSVLEAFGCLLNKVYYIFYKNGQLYSNYFEKDIGKYHIQKEDINTNDIIYLNKMFFMEVEKSGFFNSLRLENQNLYKKLFQDKNLSQNNMLDRDLFHTSILKKILNGSLNPIYFKPTKISISFNYLHKELNKDETKKYICKKQLTSRAQYKVYLKSLEIIKKDIEKESIIDFCNQDVEEILKFEYNDDENDLFFLYPLDENDIYIFLNKFIIPNIDILSSKNYDLEYFKKEFFNKENENGLANIFFYLYRIGFLKYDFYDDRGNRFSNLSSGEKSLFIDFNLMDEKINKYIKDNNNFRENNFDYKKNIELLLFVDEPDLTLHPKWQKEYIDNIIYILKKYKNITFHFIFTTHSPFLLSDIPKQNIIFLDRYKEDDKEVKNETQKEGNCKVADGLSQTFGANIHTLLSDSFFMEDGLMGEFAKGKINEIKEFYEKVNNKNKKEESDFSSFKIEYEKNKIKFEQIQSIIGEPFLKTVIKNYLDELELLFSDENTLIEKELADIEKRRIYLENLKNVED